MAALIVILGVLWGLCILSTALLRWNEVRYRKKVLPPGTMGWPVFGETTEFLKQGPDFMRSRRSRFHIILSSIVAVGRQIDPILDPFELTQVLINLENFSSSVETNRRHLARLRGWGVWRAYGSPQLPKN